MKNLMFSTLLAITAVLAAGPVSAQVRNPTAIPGVPNVPPQPLHLTNPIAPLSTPPTSPLQSQEQDDFAAQLRAGQQQLLMQNPSGVTRPELGINRALNGFTPR
jgi:hypothetical protein